jgi:formate hydrogenlyase subunit 4
LTKSAQADAGMKLITAVPWLADTEVGLELLGLDEQQIARAMSEKRRGAGSATVARAALDALKKQQVVPQANGFATGL